MGRPLAFRGLPPQLVAPSAEQGGTRNGSRAYRRYRGLGPSSPGAGSGIGAALVEGLRGAGRAGGLRRHPGLPRLRRRGRRAQPGPRFSSSAATSPTRLRSRPRWTRPPAPRPHPRSPQQRRQRPAPRRRHAHRGRVGRLPRREPQAGDVRLAQGRRRHARGRRHRQFLLDQLPPQACPTSRPTSRPRRGSSASPAASPAPSGRAASA
jgi:hypothetical protein